MSISCSDVCDVVVAELLRLGFPIDTDDESHDDIWEALNHVKIVRQDSEPLRVKVEVSGGVANVTHKDAGVTVEVFDHDNAEEEGQGYHPALYEADVTIDDDSQAPEGAELPCDLGGMQPDS